MDDRHLSGEEKRAVLREQYKQELRARKEYLEQLRRAQRSHKIEAELGKLVQMGQDDSDEWIRRLDEQSALSDAKLEMALDTALQRSPEPAASAPVDRYAHLTALERVKLEMGLVTEAELGIAPLHEAAQVPAPETREPSKSLGVSQQEAASSDASAGSKTLGIDSKLQPENLSDETA